MASEGYAPGPVAEAVQRELEDLGKADTALGKIAVNLAWSLDAGAGMAAAAVAKELRETLKELTPKDGGDEFSQLMASLSSPVRNT
jgi:hypothetical protein